MKRVLIYSHDTFGLGNIRRMLEVARHLVQASPEVSVLVITGSPMLHAFRIPQRVDYVKLPCLSRTVEGRYGARFLDLSLDATVRLRANLIRSAIADFAPDLIVVDKKPFGVEDELAGALSELPTGARRPKLVLLLRDILDSPEETSRVWRKNGCFEAIEAYYDEVLVVGSPEIFDLRHEYRFPPFAAAKVRFCGYIARQPGRLARADARRGLGVADREPLVLVTPGGGEDGHALIAASLAGLSALPAAHRPRMHIVCGPEMRDAERAALHRAASTLPQVSLQDFSDDMMSLMAAADVVVAMGGYNTVCELLTLHKRAVVVPRVKPGQEQAIRAERMSALGLLRMLHPSSLTPAALMDAVHTEIAALAGPTRHSQLHSLDGLERCTAAIFEHIGLTPELATRAHKNTSTAWNRPVSVTQRPLGVLVKIYPKLSETFILEEILGLERLGLSLRLYALAPATDAIIHPAVARVCAPLVTVPASARGHVRSFISRHAQLLRAAPLRYLGSLAVALARGRQGAADFARAGWLAVQLRNDGVAHLHSHFISAPADMAALVARLLALPFSISAHAKDIYLSEPADLKRKLEAARFTVTCTEANRAVLAGIAPHAPVHRMYHGVDHALFHPARRRLAGQVPMIVSVGRLRAKKGLDCLIDACALLRQRGQAFTCEIVGYGEEMAGLQAQIEALGLAGQVRLVGKLAREQVIERYARAAVYVQPSRIAADGDRDGIPNVLLEAMAMGLPVVASNVSGIPELVSSGVNGLLVTPDQPADLADAIVRLLKQPALCADLGCRARQTVTELFDNDINLRLLCQLLERPGGAADRLDSTNAAATATTPARAL